MSQLAADLDLVLSQLDEQAAAFLERTVREALARATQSSHSSHTDSMGYPLGYFEATAGSFANEPLDFPQELPSQVREPW